MRKFKALGALLTLILLLSSCIKYDATITIEDDGSGTVDLLTALDPSAFEALGAMADDLGSTEDLCADFSSELNDTSGLPADAQVEPYNEDGFCGSRVRYSLSPTLDHDLADATGESTRIYKQGENWFFESNFSTDEITGEAADFGDDIVGDLFDDASFKITIDLPGRAIDGETNATSVGADGKFTWDIDLLDPPTRLFAQTEPGSGGGTSGGGVSPVLIGLILAALLGAGALAWFMKQRNDDSLAATDAAPLGGVPAVGSMPLQDGVDMGVPGAAGVLPDSNAARETVVMNPQQEMADAQAAAPATPQPVYDEALAAWIVDDPSRGRLRHDPATDTWNPI